MSAYTLSYGDVALSLSLMAVAILLSRLRGLKIEKNLAVGTIRSFAQLTLVGFALKFLFANQSLPVFCVILFVMLVVASYEGMRRQTVKLPWFFLLTMFSLLLSLLLAMLVVVALIIRPEPWYNLVVSIPLGGMVLGNSLNVVSLVANRLIGELKLRRDEVEVALSLGAPPTVALQPAVRESLTAALIPAINALMTVGIVQLPGVMTGQILAGQPPVEAVKFQIVIMMMWITTGVVSGVVASALLRYVLINERWQPRWELLEADA